MNIITRIAPSPTGKFHLGTARIALINAMFTTKNNGKLYLRIDDTDNSRNNENYINDIIECLNALNIKYHSLTKQSSRLNDYSEAIKILISKGFAYKLPDNGAIALNIPNNKLITWHDAIHGVITINSNSLIGSHPFVIARHDGTPLYHLASVVDDINMGVTYVIRGDDHLTNTAKHILLFNALDATVPVFAHVPLLLGNGGKKLSKRDKTGSISDLIAAGYLPSAIAKYLLTLGTLDNISASPAYFDILKLNEINRNEIKELSNHDLLSLIDSNFPKNINKNIKLDAIDLFRDGMTLLSDSTGFINLLFNNSIVEPDAKLLLDSSNISSILSLCDRFKNAEDITIEAIMADNSMIERSKPLVFKTIRSALIGRTSGFDAISLLKFFVKHKIKPISI
jgi:glutamyl-tRNA synthetase